MENLNHQNISHSITTTTAPGPINIPSSFYRLILDAAVALLFRLMSRRIARTAGEDVTIGQNSTGLTAFGSSFCISPPPTISVAPSEIASATAVWTERHSCVDGKCSGDAHVGSHDSFDLQVRSYHAASAERSRTPFRDPWREKDAQHLLLTSVMSVVRQRAEQLVQSRSSVRSERKTSGLVIAGSRWRLPSDGTRCFSTYSSSH